MRCPLNLNSNKHNQRDGSRRFYLAILQPGQLRHRDRFISVSKPCFARRRACDSSARRLLTDASVDRRRTVTRRLQTERMAR